MAANQPPHHPRPANDVRAQPLEADAHDPSDDSGSSEHSHSTSSEEDYWDPGNSHWFTRRFTEDGVRLFRPNPEELARIHRRDPRTQEMEILFADDPPYIPPGVRPISPMFQSHSPGGSPSPRGPADFSGGSDDGDSDGGSDDSGGPGFPPAHGSASHSDSRSQPQGQGQGQGQWRSAGPAAPPAPTNAAHNRQYYPAYDEHHRIGLEHVLNPTGEHQGEGSYYMDRTRNYPSGMAASFPHVMAVELDQPGLPRQPRKRNTKAKEREDSASVVDDRVVDDHLDNDPALAPTTASGSGSDAGAASGSGSQAPGEQGASDDAFDASPFLRSQLGLPPNVPINLDCLEEPRLGEKPNYPYTTLVQLAIYGSPNKRLTLSEIYSTLESRYEWFRDSQDRSKWQGSIRHLLSLRKRFRQVARPMSCPGKGNWWVVDYSQGDGNKRERKRGRKPTKAELLRATEEEDEDEDDGESDGASERDPQPSRPFPAGFVTKFRSAPAPAGRAPPGLGADTGPVINPMFIVKTAQPFSSPAGTAPNAATPRFGAPPSLNLHQQPPTVEDYNIDPALRDHGHVVGEGRERRARSSPRQASSPYGMPSTPVRRSARLRGQDYGSRSQSPSATPEPAPRPPPALAVFGQPSFGGARMPVSTQWGAAAAAGLHPGNALGLGPGAVGPYAASPPQRSTRDGPDRVPLPPPPTMRDSGRAANKGKGKGKAVYRDQGGSNSDYDDDE